ncbi:MAG: BamA/TamA family outer membrane protein [Acidobacteria bacterium]|nr:BamA/TamA family outer membrane protein [Acidobacteriota bacterium]
MGAALVFFLLWCLFQPGMAQRVTNSRYQDFVVDSIRLVPDGRLNGITEADLQRLVTIRPGERYDAVAIQQSIQRLFGTRLFFDIRVDAASVSSGRVALTFDLVRTVFVDQIRFSGSRKLDSTQLLREVSFRETEPFDREALQDTLSRLSDFYQKNGYFHPRIRPRIEYDPETSLASIDFRIDAGEQARIERAVLDLEPPANAPAIRKEIRTQPGGKYSGLVLEQDIQDLTRQFALLGYVNAEIYVKENNYQPEQNSVSIILRINPREFYNVDTGEARLSYRQKWDLLPIYPEGSAETVFVQESAENLRRFLQERGHFLAQVQPAVRREHPRAVIFETAPGRRFSLTGIRFENPGPVSEAQLRGVLALRTRSLFSRGVYTSEILADDAERIRDLFVQHGYLDAVVTPRTVMDDGDAHAVFHCEPGSQFRVNTVRIVGNRALNDRTLLDLLRIQPGGVYSPFTVAVDRSTLMTTYENAGFSDIDFRSEVRYPSPALADVTYYLSEGDRYTVEDIVVIGNRTTRREVIQRELAFAPGEPVSLEKLLASESNLYNLGIFNRVTIDAEPTFHDPFQRLLMVRLEEARRYTLSYGAGYEEGDPRVTAGLSDNNFQGRARTLAMAFRVGTRQQRGQISYSIPRPFQLQLPTLLSLFAQHEEKRKGDLQQDLGKPFDTTRLTLLLQSERRLNSQTSLFARYNFEKVTVSNIEDLEVLFRENRPVRLSGISASLLNDRRDNPLDATRGTFSSVDLQLIPRFLGSEAQFARLFLQQQYFRPIVQETVLAISGRFGWLKPFGKNSVDPSLPARLQNPIPISERFFAGGSTSLRGFRLDQAGPLVEKTVTVNGRSEKRLVPIGGNALFIWNTEIRFPLLGIVRGAAFFDTGNVFRSLRDLSLTDFSNAVGFGLRLKTPVGPLRIDFGRNLNPPPNFKRNLFFFTIGQTF